MFYTTSGNANNEDARIISATACSLQSTKTQSVLPEPSSQAVGGITQSIRGRLHSATTRVYMVGAAGLVSLVFFESSREEPSLSRAAIQGITVCYDQARCKVLVQVGA